MMRRVHNVPRMAAVLLCNGIGPAGECEGALGIEDEQDSCRLMTRFGWSQFVATHGELLHYCDRHTPGGAR